MTRWWGLDCVNVGLTAVLCLAQLLGCKVDDRTLYPGEFSTGTDLGVAEGGSPTCGGAGTSEGCDAYFNGGSDNNGGVGNGQAGDSGGGGVGGSGAVIAAADRVQCFDRNENGNHDKNETLAKNSSFDGDSELWEPETGVGVVWTPEDACVADDSGSLRFTFTKAGSASGSDFAATAQCLTAKAASNYVFSAQLYLNNEGTRAGVGISYYSTTSCTGEPLESSESAQQMLTSKWTVSSVNAVSPPKTQSLKIRLLVGRIDWFSSDPVASVNADNLLLLELP